MARLSRLEAPPLKAEARPCPGPLTVNGALDASFSGDGRQTSGFGEPNQLGGAYGVALQGDGKIVAVGIGPGPSLTDDFAIARYLGGRARRLRFGRGARSALPGEAPPPALCVRSDDDPE